MRKLLTLTVPLLATAAFAATEPQDSWRQDQSVFGVNKETAHAPIVPYATIAEMQGDTQFFDTPWVTPKSSRRMLLNGQWKFNYSATPDQAPADFYKTTYNTTNWDKIPVPSVWQMEGYDTPMYVNVEFPFNYNNPPYITQRTDYTGYDANPVGCYVTDFTIPSDWSGQRYMLNFEGIYSGAYVWVNGKFVGYTQAANTDHEFDITDYAKTGKNTLAVKVIKWTDGSYLEDQDMYRWGGIYRDVTLSAVPQTFIRDYKITYAKQGTGFTNGTMSVDLELDNRSSASSTVTAKMTLLNPDGTVKATLPDQTVTVSKGLTKTVSTSVALTDLQLWNAETPNLYTVMFSLTDASGKELTAFSCKYGFRVVAQSGTSVRINGKKVYFKGVNRQDTDPLTGRMQTMETLLKDVKLFKQFNINTVRTSHCPHQSKMYAMYDHFGIYVMDEADLETHKMDWRLVNDDSWANAYVDRQQRMVLRDRNHPSVVFWSMGNESRSGNNFDKCRAAIQELDDRMIHYEGQQELRHSDFTSMMYPNESEVLSRINSSDSRPDFICEYAHAMGQSLGNFVDYWDYYESGKRSIGGAIWDWADQAIYDPQEIKAGTYKKGRWYTGYDYPGPHQGNFASNGIVDPERNVSQKLVEVKKVHQWIKVTDLNPDKGTVKVENTYDFTDLSAYKVLWSVLRNGKKVESGEITDFNVLSEKSKQLTVPYTKPTDDAEYLLNLEFVTREATDWAEAGHVVAYEQLAITEAKKLDHIDAESMDATLVTRGNGPVTISGKNFSYTFNANGELSSMVVNGIDYIHGGQGMKFDDVRWIENDSPYTGTPPTAYDPVTAQNKGLTCTFTDGDAKGAKAVKLTAINQADGSVRYKVSYHVYADGTIDMEVTYNAYKELGRVGMSMSLNPALENVEYYARGPLSNYCDRKTGSLAGIYTTTVTDMAEHFVKPQSMGNREEVRYVKLTSPKDPAFGLLMEMEGPTSFSALHYTEEDLGTAMHDWELQPREEIIVHLDRMQKGLGNGSCGSKIWSRYLIPTYEDLTHKIRITPLMSQGAGYSVPTGNLGTYLTEFNGEKLDKPSNLYSLLSTRVKASAGSSVKVSAKASGTCSAAAWIDWNGDGTFSSDEKLRGNLSSGWVVAPESSQTSGDYRMRVALDTAAPSAAGPINSGSVYDCSVHVVLSSGSEMYDYVTPEGTIHSRQKAYVTSIKSSGATTDMSYTAESCPASFYNLVNSGMTVEQGQQFSLNLVANEAGPRSEWIAYQDLRYNTCYIYADFYNSGTFALIGRYGSEFTGNNYVANYDVVMNITQDFTVPHNAPMGYGRIRVIYQNAWKGGTSPYMQNGYEGMAYDIPFTIAESEVSNEYTTLPEKIVDYPEGTVHPDGEAYVKRILTEDAYEDIDCSWDSQPGFMTIVPQDLKVEAGKDFTLCVQANDLGDRGEVRQDLRYNHLTVFADWVGDGDFTEVTTYGNKYPDDVVVANYDKVMDLRIPIEVPETLEEGAVYTIRLIYENAWADFPAYNYKNVLQGCAYDINVHPHFEQSSITDVNFPEQGPKDIYDLLGRKVSKPGRGLYIVNGRKVFLK